MFKLIILGSVYSVVSPLPAEWGIHDLIFAGCDRRVPPTQFENSTITVNVAHKVAQLIAANEAEGDITLKIYEFWMCTDYRLRWSLEDHAHISTVYVDASSIWLPTLNGETMFVFLNHFYNPRRTEWRPPPIELSSTAVCYMPTLYPVTMLCDVEVSAFPFDTQTCEWTVQTNAHQLPTMDLQYSEYSGIEEKAKDSPGFCNL